MQHYYNLQFCLLFQLVTDELSNTQINFLEAVLIDVEGYTITILDSAYKL